MSLRIRLVVAFFLLSVVPLAAVTLYTYTSNVKAVRDAAGHEAELLAGELTQRMEIVTAQLGQRVERLIDLTSAAQEAASAAPAPATRSLTTAAADAPQEAKSAPATAAAESQQAAATLGDLAMLLNNVELHGLRGRGGRRGFSGPPPGGGGPQQGSAGTPGPSGAPPSMVGSAPLSASGNAGAGAGAPSSLSADGAGAAASPDQFRGNRGPRSGPPPDFQRFRGDQFRGGPPSDAAAAPPAPPDTPRIGAPGMPSGPPPDATTDPSKILIDIGPIRDDIVKQFVPDGRWDQLSTEDRQRVFAEVNQRMLGIQQGIHMLQAKVAERAADAQAHASVSTASAASTKAAAMPLADAAATAKTAAVAAKPQAPAPPSGPAVPRAASVPVSTRMQRRTEISGSRLAVRVEQNGEVVGQANAEINLPNLLATVFAATRRDRGEVPFAVAKDGHLYTPTDADKRTIESLGTTAAKPDSPPGTTVLPAWVIVTTADPTGSGLKFGIARPVGGALADLQRTTARNAGFGLGFIGLALIGIVPLSSRLTRNLSSLSDGVRRIAQGDYHARVEVRSHDEVGRLARAFNQMAADVEVHQRSAVEQERLRRELELGRQIQHDMLPHVPLRLGLTEIKGVSVPAREVGGDFFNYFQLGNGTVALVLGDVSGKGVGAALLMANIQASLRTRLALGQDLAALARELDRDIEGSTPGPVYATLFVGILDPVTRVLRCVNAGHNPQFVLHQGGRLERMESTGLPIGLLAGRGYTEQRVQLAAGDLLFFYTDGCVEAENGVGDMYGSERLERTLIAAAGSSADMLLATLEADVNAFRAGKELFDDATMMVVKVG